MPVASFFVGARGLAGDSPRSNPGAAGGPRRYTVEFGLVREAGEVKAFGAGVLSSFGELEWFKQVGKPQERAGRAGERAEGGDHANCVAVAGCGCMRRQG